jgi:hypothetical protein
VVSLALSRYSSKPNADEHTDQAQYDTTGTVAYGHEPGILFDKSEELPAKRGEGGKGAKKPHD